MMSVRNFCLTVLVCLCAVGAVAPAQAQTTPTTGEKLVGRACGQLSHDRDFDTIAQCNTSAASGGTYQKAPLFVGTVTSPPYASVVCDAGKAGLIQWTGTSFQGCDGSSWATFSTGAIATPDACGSPDAQRFTNQTDLAYSTTATSIARTLGGTAFTCIGTATCSGCSNMLINGVASGSIAYVVAGDAIALQQVSSPTPSTTVTATLTVGNTPFLPWTVTTMPGPSPFSFTAQTGIGASETVTSNAVTLAGTFSNVTATCGAGCTGISRNGQGFAPGPVTGFQNGDTIAIQQTSSASMSTATTAVVTVGGTTSSPWSATTITTDTCAGSPAVGTVCFDGTLYAGLSPDGNVKMYTTRCDAGMTWTGSTCTGARGTYAWSTAGFTTGYSSQITGRANTTGLAALGATYEAATYCDTLVANGKSDWYLPAAQEIATLNSGRASIGNFYSSIYWSSSERDTSTAWYQYVSSSISYQSKPNSYYVRCTRR